MLLLSGRATKYDVDDGRDNSDNFYDFITAQLVNWACLAFTKCAVSFLFGSVPCQN